MTQITLSLDEAIVRKAEQLAQAHGQTLAALVGELIDSASAEEEYQRSLEESFRLADQAGDHNPGWTWNREELHERA